MPRKWNATEYDRLWTPQTAWGERVLQRLLRLDYARLNMDGTKPQHVRA